MARFALRNEKLIAFAVIVLALLGVRSYFIAPQSIFPAMSFARIDVVADAGDLPADAVRVAVTRPLEQALQPLAAVTTVQSTSSQGSSELVVAFQSTTDPRVDLANVNAALEQVRANIPAARSIVAVAIDPNREPVLSYAITSPDLSQAVLRNMAFFTLAPQLYGVRGMGKLLVTGGPATEYHVTLDPTALAAQGISASDVAKALADANAVSAVGTTQRHYLRYAIVVDSSLRDVNGLKRVMIPVKDGSAVPLGSIATVSLGVAPITSQVSYDGRHAVLINVFALPGADAVAMADAFKAKLADAQRRLPVDVHVALFWDQTTLIIESQKALRDAIVIGALLAIVVIYLFLRNARLTLVAAAVIPLAMAITIFALQTGGLSLNLMSVGGLAVAVGLIIDDAIVVIENIERNRHEHPAEPIDAVISRSMTQLSGAMIASTTTTVVVFVPLLLLGGVAGFFFRALSFTLATSLVVSLGLALLVAPVVARALLRGTPTSTPSNGPDAISRVLDRYEPLLRWTLAHRAVVYASSAVVLAVTVLLLARLPSDFLPKMDEGEFEIAYTLPPGTTLAASDAAALAMEHVIVADPATADVGRLTGVDSNGLSPTQPNSGLLRVRLKPRAQRDGYDAVSDRMRDALTQTVPSSLYDFHQILEDLINDLSGAPAAIEVVIAGPDQQRLIDLATQVAKKLAAIPGIVDPSNGVVYDNPSLRIAPSGTRLAALGATSADVGDALTALTQGSVATSVTGTQSLIPVRVAVAPQSSDIASQPLFAKGAPTALGDVATITTLRLQSDISAVNSQTVVRVTANISGATLSTVTDALRRTLSGVALPPGYTTRIAGEAATQQQSFSEFLNVIAIAVALVFAVMLAAFRSFRLPLVILTAIPLALIGVALALALTGTPFNVSSFMGLLLLVGVVVKNGILLIDVANKRLAAGDDVETALVRAGKTRLRPIVMTTLAAICGLVPLALGIGQGAEMERPLAIAVIGGLSTATIFTLLVIPTLYAAFVGNVPPRALLDTPEFA